MSWVPAILGSIGLAVTGCIGVSHVQRSLIYHPTGYDSNQEALLAKCRLVAFKTTQGQQYAYYLPSRKETKRVWVLFGGNGAKALGWVGPYTTPYDHIGYLLIEYPGYGNNEGQPSPQDILTNAVTAFDRIANETKGVKFGVVGHSLGCATGLLLAQARPEIDTVILMAPFTSIVDMAQQMLGFNWGLSWILTHNYDNVKIVTELMKRAVPPRIHIYHGTRDEVIPFKQGLQLAALSSQIDFHTVKHGSHNDIVDRCEYEIGAMMGRT